MTSWFLVRPSPDAPSYADSCVRREPSSSRNMFASFAPAKANTGVSGRHCGMHPASSSDDQIKTAACGRTHLHLLMRAMPPGAGFTIFSLPSLALHSASAAHVLFGKHAQVTGVPVRSGISSRNTSTRTSSWAAPACSAPLACPRAADMAKPCQRHRQRWA